VNASGLIETVASGVPRLDYTNSTCPKLLLEPQRTNYLINSNTVGGTGWSYGAPVTVTENYATSPAGTQTASRIQWDGTNAELYQYTGQPSTRSSVYIKGTAGQVVSFCLTQITLTGQWQRIQANSLIDGSNTWWGIILRNDTGHTATDFLLWGAQAEVGSYITSLIPTTSAAVTRLADAASKTGISSLIGQTEGTIFFEADVTNSFGIQLGNSTSSGDYINSIQIAISASSTNAGCHVGGVSQMNFAGAGRTGVQKIALAYKQNDFVLYANGTQLTTDTSASVPAMAAIIYNHVDLGTQNGKLAQTLLFKTRLTNAQLAELTTL
jgi:hypothetical protein